MKRLAPYIKPYVGALLLAVALLFIQANADLALPDYMSRIVNVGIQQGGVDSAVPEEVRSETMQTLLLFLSADESSQVLAAYEENDSGVFGRTDLSSDELNALNPIMAKAWLAVSAIRSAGNADGVAPSEEMRSMVEQLNLDLSRIPPGTDPIELIRTLPVEAREQIADAVATRFEAMGPTMLVQAAAGPVGAEYEALGFGAGSLQSRYILRTGGVMLLLTLLSVTCTILVGFLSARIAAGFSRDLRAGVFERVQRFSGQEFDRFSTASLITRSTNDVMQIQLVTVMLVRMVFYAPIIGVGGVIRAIGKSSSMWWVIAVAVGILSVLVLVVYKVAVPKFKIMQKLMDAINRVSRESLAGMMVIRAFAMQRHEESRFDTTNRELTDTTLFVNRVMVIMMPLMMFIMNGLTVLIIWVGAKQVESAAMQVGDVMAFLQYTMQIVFAFLMLSMMFIMLPRAAVSADRIAEVLDSEPTIRDPEAAAPFPRGGRAAVEFHDVCFRYPGAEKDVLHNISFSAPPGQTTAIIGATGAGKSTIVNLIPRFYDVTAGSITVAGSDIRSVTQHDLREWIGYVPQRASLFSGTIGSNLRYGDAEADEETVAAAARVAQAREFIDERDEKLDAPVSQGGANVSGGQKQRLSIARALVKKPPIYLFDDSFSALDFKTDAALRRELRSFAADSTRIIVTQRVATVKGADQIIVLDHGRIVGSGTHHELMASCETYREIAFSQLTEEELA
jgi:ATP-binding cassette subfamily B protein